MAGWDVDIFLALEIYPSSAYKLKDRMITEERNEKGVDIRNQSLI